MLLKFPFPIKGFHSGNGSEYVNGALSDTDSAPRLQRAGNAMSASLERAA